jgi:hypothetical protein
MTQITLAQRITGKRSSKLMKRLEDGTYEPAKRQVMIYSAAKELAATHHIHVYVDNDGRTVLEAKPRS